MPLPQQPYYEFSAPFQIDSQSFLAFLQLFLVATTGQAPSAFIFTNSQWDQNILLKPTIKNSFQNLSKERLELCSQIAKLFALNQASLENLHVLFSNNPTFVRII